MSYSELIFEGPDIFGQTFTPHPVAHCVAWEEELRRRRTDDRLRRAVRDRRATRRRL